MERTCATCALEVGSKCKIFKSKISYGCYAWADEKEAKKRERACEEYWESHGGKVTPVQNKLTKEQVSKKIENREANKKKRGGLSVRQMLDKYFNEHYEKGLNDHEIAKKLYLTPKSVSEYRNKLNLKPNYRNKKRLREQANKK